MAHRSVTGATRAEKATMNGRERMTALLNKQAADRLSWTALVDDPTLDLFPAELRGGGGIDFYRHVGCDVFLLNGWNLPLHLRSPELEWGPAVRTETVNEGTHSTVTWHSPQGSLVSVTERGHPMKYPVD